MFVPKLIVCLREGYSGKQFLADLQAGLVVGLVALPLAMAFAIASGLTPERGLFTAIVAGFLISALGGSRVQIGGPTGAFVVIVAGIVAQHGYAGLTVATLMAGVILIVMGISRLGSLVKFIPYPVTTGFTSGIAMVIFSSQVRDFLGLSLASVPADFVAKWRAYAEVIETTNLRAVAIALGTVACIALWPKRWKKVPGPIVALVGLTAIATVAKLPIETIGSRFGGIPHSLPKPAWPDFSWAQVKLLFPSAMTVALLGAIESLLSAVVADGMIGGKHKSNMELVAQGIANIVSPLFGGIPATGAIARTATNVNNGGRTPVAGMVHTVTLVAILWFASPLAARVPLAVLSGILVMVCYHMSEWRSFRFHLSGPMSDRIVLLITFLLTVFVDLTVAVEAGMIMAAFLFMKNMAELTQVKEIQRDLEDRIGDDLRELKVPSDVAVFSIHGAFFFAAVHKLIEIERAIAKKPRALILDMTDVLHIDSSGLHVLMRLSKECHARSIRLILAGIHAQPLMVLEQADQVEALGLNNIQANLRDALREIHAA
jgi:sulfate permease, SulP family